VTTGVAEARQLSTIGLIRHLKGNWPTPPSWLTYIKKSLGTKFYSYRRAIRGSTRVARRAGM
jgi:hypothetical protein